jgi:glycosyl-4,4'-diaponeurosporenoate acyltransferase
VQTLRSTIALVATAIGFGVCFFMLQNAIGPASPWLGLLFMFYFMGLARIAQPLFMLRMPRTLRAVRAWEMSGPTYGRLAVYGFGKVLRNTPLRHLNSSVYLASRQRDLGALYRHVESAEAIHFWALVLFTPYIAFIWLQRQRVVATLFVLIQLLFNVYPILHLRTLRGRLDELFARRHAKRHTKAATNDA